MSAFLSRAEAWVAAGLLAGAPGCRDDAGGDGEDTTTEATGTGGEGSSAGGSADTDDGYEVPLPEPPPPGGECDPGVVEPCTCEGGGAGERVCLPDGRFSACGCTQDDGVYEPPPPPDYEYCGDTPCPPYPFPPSDYSAQHCCTPENACGSTNTSLFVESSAICIARGGDSGSPSPDCPDESIAFVDFLGCCMPSGQCGMTLDETMPNWDVGCIDRSLWKPMLDGLSTRWFAAILFGFDPNVPDWQPIACTPAE